MEGRFRVSPPLPQAGWIERPRVLARLARRFEVPITVVVAPAGYGKTSALSQAIEAVRVAGTGTDFWVQCRLGDDDPDVLGRAVIRAVGLTDAPGKVDAARIADALASFAPTHVCLVLDDVHRVPAGAPTWRLVDELIAWLPANTHVVLSSRTEPPCALARRRAAGEVAELSVADLQFDDDELAAGWSARGIEPPCQIDEATRWPALAALAAVSQRPRSVDQVLEDLIGIWTTERFAALAALAHLNDIDDVVARAAACAPTVTAARLLAELPLVQRSASGTFQLHDLWRHTLTDPTTWERRHADAAVRAALVRVGRARLASDRPLEAAELFAAADDAVRLVEAGLTFTAEPFLFVARADLARMAAIARDALGDHLLTDLVECAHAAIGGAESAAAEGFEAIARRAELSGDGEIEAIALQHAVNMRSILDPDAVPAWIADRADALAEKLPTAVLTAAMARYHLARAAGRPDEAAAVLQAIVPPSNDRARLTYSFGMNDLGRPDQVPTVDPTRELAASELSRDLPSLWLRGDLSPERALQLGTEVVVETNAGGFPHHEGRANAMMTIVALTAGRTTEARRFADAALRRSAATSSLPVRAFAALADALCLMCEHGDIAGAARLDAVLDMMPIARWPRRPYLWALPAVYALAPSVRPTLDGCRFGPSITAALDAGRALVALRTRGDPDPAVRLAWHRPDLLRAHVLPPHLGELAAAAAAAGRCDVGLILESVPAAREHLAAVTVSNHPATAKWAAARIVTMPARPAVDLSIDVLGPIRLWRGVALATDDDWVRRERVRELLAFLTLHRRVARRTVAEALWPDLDPDKGVHNLRVNLAHLQRVLQPGRPTKSPPWYLRVDAESLELVSDGVVVDVDVFDELLTRARRFDGEGRTREALETLCEALELVRGGYLEDWPEAGWAEIERLRLRTLVSGAHCRAGELLLALGEPELAAGHASAVLADEPLQERAARLLAHAAAARGDVATSHRVISDLLTQLATAGLQPEPDTRTLALATCRA